jgi:hypothetical protein
MPVEGPLGVRTMNWQNGSEIVSPLHTSFRWDSKIAWAKCNCDDPHPMATPPYDPEEFPEWPTSPLLMLPGRNCGIWASINIQLVHDSYANYKDASVLFLCEGLGSIYIYQEGFRASGVELIAVIKPDSKKKKKLGRYHTDELRMLAAADMYGIPVINQAVADIAIKKQIEKFILGGEYDHKHDDIDPFA